MTHRADFVAWCNDTNDTDADSDMLPAGASLPGPRPALIGDYVPTPRAPIDVRLLEPVLADMFPGTTWYVSRDHLRLGLRLCVSRGDDRVDGRCPDHMAIDDVLTAVRDEAERMFALLPSGLDLTSTTS